MFFMNVSSGNFCLTMLVVDGVQALVQAVVTLSAIMINVGANNRPST